MIDLGVALFSTGDSHQRWLSFGPALTMGKARQIADRFHLLKNLRETIERRPGALRRRSENPRSRSKTIPARGSKS
jgi:hypothetical protein